MSELLLVEDVALLLLSDDTGWMRGQYHELVLAGALATELAIRGRIRLTEKGEREVRKGRVVMSNACAVGCSPCWPRTRNRPCARPASSPCSVR